MKSPRIKQEHKWYVDINTGRAYQLPNTVDGDALYTVKPKFYEITEAQAVKLGDGVPLNEVIREAAELKIQAEVAQIKAEAAPLEEPAEPESAREPQPAPVELKEAPKAAPAKKAPAKKVAPKKED